MRRIMKLPPLKITPVLAVNTDNHTSGHDNNISTSSDVKHKDLIFDYVLVYTEELTIKSKPYAKKPSVIQRVAQYFPVRPSYSQDEKKILRTKFEDYLKTNYQLEIVQETVEETINKYSIFKLCCRKQILKKTVYVIIHASFYVLLLSAENVRMKLPIEEIESKKENASTQTYDLFERDNYDGWNSFIRWIKRLFKDPLSSAMYRPFFRTAVFSLANIDQFIKFFDKRNPSEQANNSSDDKNFWKIAKKNYFTISERHWLIYELLSRVSDKIHVEDSAMRRAPLTGLLSSSNTYKYYGIQQLISDGIYDSYFPLHEKLDDESNDRHRLSKNWATMRRCLKFQPLHLIRSYMGEKVAFYFAAIGSYTVALIPASIIGLIVFIYGVVSIPSDKPTSDICDSFGLKTDMCPLCDKTCPFWKLSDSCAYAKISYVFDNVATVVFAILMSIWARGFVEWWKRHQSTLQYKWDSIDFHEFNEPIRPDFEKQVQLTRLNPKTGRIEPYIGNQDRLKKILISTSVVLSMIIIVCLIIFGTIVYRIQLSYVLKKNFNSSQSSIIITVTSAMMNLISSLILSKLYYWIARKLTDQEFYKYQSQYESAFSIKVYIFEFVNFYSSLFYIAYFKGRTSGYPSTYGIQRTDDFNEQCDPAGCMVELSIQLFIIMFGKQTINNVIEYGYPFFCSINVCKHKIHKTSEQWIIDNELNEFDWEMLVPEYLEMTLQFGFVTLFVAAFPLAPLFALLNNLLELRLDAWKFLTTYRRPALCKAADIGVWTDILSIISYFAVVTNAAVIAWTSEFIPKVAYQMIDDTGPGLDGYVNWTLSSFPINDYNKTGTINPNVPSNLTYCRYRDFRESTGPNYSHTLLYWHIIAARLAFMIIFENVIYLIVYLVQLFVPDVPSQVQEDIDRQRYTEQRSQIPTPQNPSQVKKVIEEAKKRIQSADNNQTESDSTNTNLLKRRYNQETNTDPDAI